jgi:hypothetical protein
MEGGSSEIIDTGKACAYARPRCLTGFRQPRLSGYHTTKLLALLVLLKRVPLISR